MKLISCCCKTCQNRRKHYEEHDVNRYQQLVEVPDDFIGRAYCSIECMLYDEHDRKETKDNPTHNMEV